MKNQAPACRRLAVLCVSTATILSLLSAAPCRAGSLKVTATIHPIADIARRVGGGAVSVHTLLKPGQGPHTYEPTPGDMRAIEKSDMVVVTGFGLEEWLDNLLEPHGKPGRVVVDLSEAAPDPIKSATHFHGNGQVNPHYWLDPIIMARAAERVGDAMAAKLPAEAENIHRRAAKLAERIRALDEQIRAALGKPGLAKSFVAFHNAWEYFAARYGLEQAGVIETAPGREPSARHMIELIEKIKESGARAVLTEPRFPPRLAETLAREAGVRVVEVDPIGGVPGREGYIELMRYNAGQFVKALSP
ncbi:MAG: metal ABC transporter substrate-binding protein [Candidatus Nitrospinota bacterium M3_3B_026]